MKYHKQLLAVTCMFLAFAANAQKLPSIQQTSLRAPVNFKIDGKALELNDTFEAYNHSCDIYYTICNDDDNLYLIIKATYPQVINKIVNSGITFMVLGSEKKNDPLKMSVTYPVLDKNNPIIIKERNMHTDTFVSVTNKKMHDWFKVIKTRGIKNVDTLISVYNNDGISGNSALNNKLAYTYELSVSLKHFNLSTDHPRKFAYHIITNALAGHGVDIVRGGDGQIRSINITGPNAQLEQAATDFWGDYMLAGK